MILTQQVKHGREHFLRVKQHEALSTSALHSLNKLQAMPPFCFEKVAGESTCATNTRESRSIGVGSFSQNVAAVLLALFHTLSPILCPDWAAISFQRAVVKTSRVEMIRGFERHSLEL